MTPFRVVVVVDVDADRVVRFGTRLECAAMHEFFLQGREEALRHGVVPTVTSGAHAAFSAVLVEQQTVLGARVLTAAVGVVHEAGGRAATAQSMPQRCDGEVTSQGLAQGPTD